MESFPPIQIGWLNGWLLLALLVLTDTVMFLIFQRDVVKRLFDQTEVFSLAAAGHPSQEGCLSIISVWQSLQTCD